MRIRTVDQGRDVPHLRDALAKEHNFVIISVWRDLTCHSIENIDKAKWVHRQLANVVLNVFGSVMGH